jgi:hypothetical protein
LLSEAGLSFDLEAPSSPAAVGERMTYAVKLHNQGPASLSKLHVVVTLPDDAEMLDVKGPTSHRQEGRQVIFKTLASLPARGEASFEINVKPLRAGTLKCRAELRCKQLGYRPLLREQTVTVP